MYDLNHDIGSYIFSLHFIFIPSTRVREELYCDVIQLMRFYENFYTDGVYVSIFIHCMCIHPFDLYRITWLYECVGSLLK